MKVISKKYWQDMKILLKIFE